MPADRSAAAASAASASAASFSPRHHHSPASLTPSPPVSHRSSLAEHRRSFHLPPSPRAQRTPSFSGAMLTELLMNSPAKARAHVDGGADDDPARFLGRDWRTVPVHEIIDPAETRFVELATSVEEATKLLVRSGPPNVVLVRESTKTRTAVDVFGYDDLNAYLLLVLGLARPHDAHAAQLAQRARAGQVVSLGEIRHHLGPHDEPVFLPHTAPLPRAMTVLGGGPHRVVICREGSTEAVGVLSQLRLVRFFWENQASFAATEALYARSLLDLRLGAKEVIAIPGERPLSDALMLMLTEGITSLPVLDGQRNVVGNISHVDVRLLTDTSSIPLLSASCLHFISVILSERGVADGKDSYPVFHVTPFSTLAHTVAKLCATRSHRMWIVDAPSPSTSVPPSPGGTGAVSFHHGVPPSPISVQNTNSHAAGPGGRPAGPGEISSSPHHAGSGAGFPGLIAQQQQQLQQQQQQQHSPPSGGTGGTTSGRLSGVVSLTDVLNLLARASGLSPDDPEDTRRRRRRSSLSGGSLGRHHDGAEAGDGRR